MAAQKNKIMKQHVRVVFDRKKASAKTGTGKIELCVYLKEGERKWITVGTASPENWMSVSNSRSITSKVEHYEQVIKAMELLKEDMTISNFNRYVEFEQLGLNQDKVLFNGNDLRQSFVEFCRKHMEQENLAQNSIKDIKVVLKSVEESGLLNTLADLTPANVRAYDAWLRKPNTRTDYTINGYHKKVRKYTKILWQQEIISIDPYDHVKFPKGTNKERHPLTENEIIKIRDAEFYGRKDRARDLFVFMAYTGLAYCDMCLFNFKTMTEMHDDYYYIDGARLKTGSNFFTPILPPALAVLEKYDFKLPIISNQKLNDYLHLIQDTLDIRNEVTCHIGRHSFATLMLTYGIPIEKVKRMLGHKNIATTQIYAKILKKNVEDSVNEILPTLR